jgi:hypothetical protein
MVAAAEALGLVGDDRVAAVDFDLVLERVADAAGGGGHAHRSHHDQAALAADGRQLRQGHRCGLHDHGLLGAIKLHLFLLR